MDNPLTMAIHSLEAIAIIVLGVGLIMLARVLHRFKSSLDKANLALDNISREARPVLDRARAVGENLNFIVMSVRKEVDHASRTISLANERLEAALDEADARVQDLGALIDVVQTEVEDTILSATSALRGIRAGAKALRRRERND